MGERLIRVVAPHFVAGFITNGRVIRCAPILGYMMDRDDDWVRAYIEKKGWKATVVRVYET